MITGILTGFAAAFAQSLSYIFSRIYIGRYQSAVLLLTLSHIVMGVLSVMILPFLNVENKASFWNYALPLAGCSLFYIFGQISFFMALKKTDASRLSPLLGLKILFLAFFFSVFIGQKISAVQWVAVLMSMSAAVMLNWSGGRMPWRGIAWILTACVFYSLSDMNIKIMIDKLAPGGEGLVGRSLFSACACYVVCGVIGVFTLFFIPRPGLKMCADALPFSLAWFGGMLFLFTCFGYIGPVFGNIVQSSRGLISIIIGAIIAMAGFPEIEKKVSRGVFLRRILAGMLMLAAIALFSAGKHLFEKH